MFPHPTDATLVVKMIQIRNVDQIIGVEDVMRECRHFNTYYGDGAAEYLGSTADLHFMTMIKVPGTQLERVLAFGAVPTTLPHGLQAMLARLVDLGLVHHDLHAGNILIDADTRYCYPVDFGQAYCAEDAPPRRRPDADLRDVRYMSTHVERAWHHLTAPLPFLNEKHMLRDLLAKSAQAWEEADAR